jgi:hypothetical protein
VAGEKVLSTITEVKPVSGKWLKTDLRDNGGLFISQTAAAIYQGVESSGNAGTI